MGNFANRSLGYEHFQKLTDIKLNIPDLCPPRRVFLVNQGRDFASLFHLGMSSSLSVGDATTPAISPKVFPLP